MDAGRRFDGGGPAALAASADDSGRTLVVLAGSVLHAYPLFRRVLKDRPRVVRVPLVSGHVAVGLVVPKEKEELLVEELPPIPFDDDGDAYHDDCVVEGHQRWATQLDAALVSQRALQRSLPHYDDDEAAWQACWATLRQHDSQDLEPDEIAERQRREAKLRDFHAQISRRKRAEAPPRALMAAAAAAAAAASARRPARRRRLRVRPAVAAASAPAAGRRRATSPASAPAAFSPTAPAGASAAAALPAGGEHPRTSAAAQRAAAQSRTRCSSRSGTAAHAAERPAADGSAAARQAGGGAEAANVCGSGGGERAAMRARGAPFWGDEASQFSLRAHNTYGGISLTWPSTRGRLELDDDAAAFACSPRRPARTRTRGSRRSCREPLTKR